MDKTRFLYPALVTGIGGGMWIGTWVALIGNPLVLFCLSYPVMLVGLGLVARARDKT